MLLKITNVSPIVKLDVFKHDMRALSEGCGQAKAEGGASQTGLVTNDIDAAFFI